MRSIEDMPTAVPAMQQHLFGEPEQDPESSQWWTPLWLALKAASLMTVGARIIEPSCGSGNLIEALLRLGHDPCDIVGVERDPAWAKFARERFGGRVTILCADFLDPSLSGLGLFDECLQNPPFEEGLHEAFVLRALDLAPTVVGVLPVSIEYGKDRDAGLWSQARVEFRARLPERVKYGGDHSASFDTVALRIRRRLETRRLNETVTVAEEVWRKS